VERIRDDERNFGGSAGRNRAGTIRGRSVARSGSGGRLARVRVGRPNKRTRVGIEQQLKQIRSKDEMHRVIDDLPDGSQALVIFVKPDPSDERIMLTRMMNYGALTVKDVLYLLRCCEYDLMSVSRG
jgi:hypothetical protein